MKRDTLCKMRTGSTAGSVLLGTWISSGCPVIAELASLCGFDWLLLDMEHGWLTESALQQCLLALGRYEGAVIVRVPTHEPGLISRVLDWGADGIMAPHVESAAEAKALVRAMRYPPHGARGFSRSVRAWEYGLASAGADSDREGDAAPLLLAQIESVGGLRQVDEIADVPGVDVLFVGPADLKLSLSCDPNGSGLTYEQALWRTVDAARHSGKAAGILLRDPKEFAATVDFGFSTIAVDSDMAILRKGFQTLVSATMTTTLS